MQRMLIVFFRFWAPNSDHFFLMQANFEANSANSDYFSLLTSAFFTALPMRLRIIRTGTNILFQMTDHEVSSFSLQQLFEYFVRKYRCVSLLSRKSIDTNKNHLGIPLLSSTIR